MSWYFEAGGKQLGPVDEAAFENLVGQGEIRDETLVWREGMAGWQPYGMVRPRAMAAAPTVMMPPPFAPAAAAAQATAPPPAPAAQATAAMIPSYGLYTPGAVALATLLGSPIAGGVLLGLNYKRLGQRNRLWPAILGTVLVTALLVVVGSFIDSNPATTSLGVVLTVAMRAVAKSLQGDAIDRHTQSGGRTESMWAAAGIGLAGLVVVFGSILGVYLAREALLHPKVTIGTKDTVTYTKPATREDAERLGEALKRQTYFSDRGASVLLSKDPKASPGTTVAFVVKDGTWDRPEMVEAFEEIGREVAPETGGFPIRIQLANADQETKLEEIVGRVDMGSKDEVFYYGLATEETARALGEALKKAGLFQGQGTTVLYAKEKDGTTVSFVVREGYWEDPEHVKAFENLLREVAPSVGGLPARMRLKNAQLETKAEVRVE